MTVYILENGSYSDTRVVGVYSTLAHAEMAARIFKDEANIYEVQVDNLVDQMQRGAVPYFVRLERETGNTLECYAEESSYGAFESGVGEDVHKNLYSRCWAQTNAEAVKIASERRRAFLALPEVGAVKEGP